MTQHARSEAAAGLFAAIAFLVFILEKHRLLLLICSALPAQMKLPRVSQRLGH
ncbi:hypothetical protein ACPOL_3318 [Acidisarcina polymorpha]|uniref:Uncharacterized protein n=1 Tax=Acidisarcina polymorpha TaxID=2211140 RepID=A0A2Z5G0P1_9BACT|nr:hypothetical protein ACPOL_3318 [Acidisarcina polymorpha]